MQSSSLFLYVEQSLSVLFFDTAGAKKSTKRNAESVSPLRRRRGLRALDLRRLLEKAGENFRPVEVIR